jgi:hypothetical protein
VTLETFIRSLETQRKRRNSNRKPNGRETDQNSTDCELRTVCYSTTDSSQVKNLKTNSAEAVLFPPEKPLLQYCRQSRLEGRTVRKYGHRATKKAQKKSQLPDCPLQYHRLSANRETAGTESSENHLLSSIFRFAAKSSPTATKLDEHDHKAVGELPLRGHHPI